jgi:hypothetical protein
MGYNIELSFNIFKVGSGVTRLLQDIKQTAEKHFCEDFYENYEYENNAQFQRRHCVIYLKFSESKLNNMIEFLNSIKKNSMLYVELIYDEKTHSVLYASQYFLTQKMDKYAAKIFKTQKRKRSYSEDEIMILNSI